MMAVVTFKTPGAADRLGSLEGEFNNAIRIDLDVNEALSALPLETLLLAQEGASNETPTPLRHGLQNLQTQVQKC